jgi:hypothetical protein
MSVLLLSLMWAKQSFAQNNSTALEGWQFDDDRTRSTWAIVWTCFSTMIACTWTAVHPPVPKRDTPDLLILTGKACNLFLAILAPELLTLAAADNFYRAKSMAALCNSVQIRKDSEKGGLEPSPLKHARPLELTQTLTDVKLHPVQTEWSIAQGFCINMRGLVLKTQDDWTYPIGSTNVQAFIDAGVIKCSDFSDRDIKDRTKADSFAKAFTVLQTSWAMCNIVARAAYNLPISLIELTTVAYVACFIITYALWWHKPKDMTTPIMINLPYARDDKDMPHQVRNILDARREGWVHLRGKPAAKSTASQIWKRVFLFLTLIDDTPPESQPTESDEKKLTIAEEALLDALGLFTAVLFCGIHVAA